MSRPTQTGPRASTASYSLSMLVIIAGFLSLSFVPISILSLVGQLAALDGGADPAVQFGPVGRGCFWIWNAVFRGPPCRGAPGPPAPGRRRSRAPAGPCSGPGSGPGARSSGCSAARAAAPRRGTAWCSRPRRRSSAAHHAGCAFGFVLPPSGGRGLVAMASTVPSLIPSMRAATSSAVRMGGLTR